jgi:DNA-binding Lrp family transcriptional regulator
MQLTAFDKQLLNLIQSGLPLTPAPFADIARQLGSDESHVIERISQLQDRGLICRFGAFFDAESLGYKGRLVAARVAPEFLPQVALAINELSQVSHNDERDNEYNLWFTVILRLIDLVAQMEGVEEVISMPTSERFKVNVEFQVK